MKNIVSKTTTIASSLALAVALAAPSTAAAAEHVIDSSHTFVIFEIGHLGIGKAHGMFRKVTGSFDPEAGKLMVTIDANSVFTASSKRDKHLRSPDFFNTKQFPMVTLKSKKITKKGEVYVIAADLTMKGKTKPVEFEMKKVGEGKGPQGEYRTGFSGTLTINRMDNGVDFYPGALSNEVKLTLSVEGIRK